MSGPYIVGISGATGAIYGIETLRALKELGLPAHLIVSEMGIQTIAIETDLEIDEVRSLADETYSVKDLGAAVSSGSFPSQGMIIAPCSIKTLSGIAHSFSYNLMIRAADVTLKEGRPLVLMVRETPLHKGHLELMAKAADIGAVIHPPVPAFYNKPESITDLVRQSVGRALDHLKINHDLIQRWEGG
ncbi:MAG: UbiX family flavin prenyltransferase [Rhodospirillales bacterium]|nr:UbiX family flavin prenyltransferase [Rhodospirillales bacterium]